ncbi:unnamed protein product [Amoebophrya sp. A120]|nr:unnamed protein product [Amoebophrya sp. A120]|eukprot:GSA120T00017341001.1
MDLTARVARLEERVAALTRENVALRQGSLLTDSTTMKSDQQGEASNVALGRASAGEVGDKLRRWIEYAKQRFPLLSKLFRELVLDPKYGRLLNKTFRGPDQAAFVQLALPPTTCNPTTFSDAGGFAQNDRMGSSGTSKRGRVLLSRLVSTLGVEQHWDRMASHLLPKASRSLTRNIAGFHRGKAIVSPFKQASSLPPLHTSLRNCAQNSCRSVRCCTQTR